jgi:hypothetical protein
MDTKNKLPEHVCASADVPTTGFCPLHMAALEKMITFGTAPDRLQAELKKWCTADSVNNPPVLSRDHEGFQTAFTKALLSNNRFVMYCGLCFAPLVFITPHSYMEGQA